MPNPDFDQNSPRRTARGHTIVPFPELMRASDINFKKKTIWIQRKSSAPEKHFTSLNSFPKKYTLNPLNTTVRHLKVHKVAANALNTSVKKFEMAHLAAEREIDQLFRFLGEEGEDPKYDLKLALENKVERGEIATMQQLEHFLKKARELANCLELYLQKNAYNTDFMQEVSYDIFVNGFEANSQESITQKYPNYFS